MADRVKPEQFQGEMKQILEEYAKVTNEGFKKATDLTAKETVKKIKSKAPRRKGKAIRGGQYAPGAYAKGWTSRKTMETSHEYRRLVCNPKHYPLTHLLQNGHALKGYLARRTTKTRVRAIPHIPPDDETERLFDANVRKEIE